MELLVLAFFAWLIFKLVAWIISESSDESATKLSIELEELLESRKQEFGVQLDIASDALGDTEVEWLRFLVSGPITAPRDNYPVRYVFRAEDISEGAADAHPVLCMVDDLQEEETTIFLGMLPEIELPYAHSYMERPTEIFKIPLLILQLPRQGARRLRVTVDVVSSVNPPRYAFNSRLDAGNSILLATATATVSVQQAGRGYLDEHDARDKVEELTIRLAVLVSAVDGTIDRAEGAVVQNWAKKRIARFERDADKHAIEKQRLNGYMKNAMKQLSNPRAELPSVLKELEGVAEVGDLYDAVELCLHVAKADGEAHPKELEFIQSMARSLDLDLDRIQEMVQAHLPAVMHVDKSSPEAMLGIPSGATPQEAKKVLMQQYRKWSALESHSDAAKREQAKSMIALIGELRQKYS